MNNSQSSWDSLNSRPPTAVAQYERPVHSLLAALLATGRNYTDIARILDKSVSWVSQAARSQDVIRKVLELQKNYGKELLEQIQQLQSVEAQEVVYRLMHESARDDIRLKAAFDILDRAQGKPTQKITISAPVPPTTEDIDRELEEISRLRKEMSLN